MNKKQTFFGGLAITVLFFGVLITGLYNKANQGELGFAEIRIGYYNSDVKENVSILNSGFTGSGDKLLERTELLLRFINLNESRDYVLDITIKGGYSKFSNLLLSSSSFKIPITINTTITGIALCAYEYSWNITTLEFYSLTLYPLIWIVLSWS